MSFRDHSSSVPSRGSYHRRAQSEVQFRIPDDFDLDLAPFDDDRHVNFEDLGSEDDFFRASTDFDNSRSKLQLGPSSAPKPEFGGESSSNDNGNGGKVENSGEGEKAGRPRHRHCNSTDEFSGLEAIEAKKAMAPDKLAELWTIDPKRAKRILANRQSAARSKERKARYVLELERKIQTLQIEATTLSAQLNLFQRDTNGLTTENTELKLQLQAMEQQAKLCDAVNDALKKEVDRLKFATGETISPSDTFRLGMHQMSYPQASFFSHQPQHGPIEPQTMQMQQLRQLPSNVSNSHQPLLPAANPHDLSEMLPQDSLGQFQELEIDSRGSHFVMLDGPSAMAFDI